MKRLFAAGALLALFASCAACDEPPSSVTFTVTNRLDWPIFVQDERGQLGLTVQRHAEGEWIDAAEASACACEECSEACGYCLCPKVQTMARRIAPGQSAQRGWDGEYRAAEAVACDGTFVPCLGDRLAAQPGTYRLKLCWATNLESASGGEELFPADFGPGLACAYREFEHPADGEVEIETSPPSGCRVAADCAPGQMCLGGRCSATCLPHEIPALGGEWNVEVGVPDDAGLFEISSGADGAVIYEATGEVSSVRYSAGTTNLTLVRWEEGIDYRATLYFTLPARRTVAFKVGEQLSVRVVDHPEGDRQLARAVVIRRAGELVLAADNGLGGPALDEPSAIAPFTVETEPVEIIACEQGDCGQRAHRRTIFAATGSEPLILEPGKSGELKVGGVLYEVVAVASYSDEVEGCSRSPVTPYAILGKQEDAP
ncbi:MAG: hypothetical protein ACOX6T_26715 [Myxococcales bacterium]